MGCDWIEAGCAYIGFKVPYDQVFRISDSEELRLGDELHEDSYHYVRIDWCKYLLESHPEIIPYQLGAFAGCTSKPGRYESLEYCSECFVLFGYKVKSEPTNDGDEVVCNLSYKFPKTLPQIIGGFIEYLHTRRKVRKFEEEPRRKISVPFDMTKLKEPEVVTFLGDRFYGGRVDFYDYESAESDDDEENMEKDEPDAKRARK